MTLKINNKEISSTNNQISFISDNKTFKIVGNIIIAPNYFYINDKKYTKNSQFLLKKLVFRGTGVGTITFNLLTNILSGSGVQLEYSTTGNDNNLNLIKDFSNFTYTVIIAKSNISYSDSVATEEKNNFLLGTALASSKYSFNKRAPSINTTLPDGLSYSIENNILTITSSKVTNYAFMDVKVNIK